MYSQHNKEKDLAEFISDSLRFLILFFVRFLMVPLVVIDVLIELYPLGSVLEGDMSRNLSIS
jgi:hypothetical protein